MESIDRILPIIRIHESDYYVDMEKMQFRQVDDAKNSISFKDVFDHGSHTSVVYDPVTKNAFKGNWNELGNRPDVKIINLPPALELDTQYIADKLQLVWRRKYLENKLAREKEEREKKNPKQELQQQSKKKRGHGL